LTLEVFEDDVGLSRGEGVEVEHLDDVGVAQSGGNLRLAPEPLEHLLGPCSGVEQDLHRDVLAGKPQMLRGPHRPHPAAADQGLDAVGLADDGAHVEEGVGHREAVYQPGARRRTGLRPASGPSWRPRWGARTWPATAAHP